MKKRLTTQTERIRNIERNKASKLLIALIKTLISKGIVTKVQIQENL